MQTSFSATDDFMGEAVSLSYDVDNQSSRTACANITIVEDESVENNETFAVMIDTTDSSVIIQRNSALVTIIDNDGIVIF